MRQAGLAVLLSGLVAFGAGFGQPPLPKPDWGAWEFLLGDWVGEGGGAPGQGQGQFSFALELQKRILVRRNRSEYPATQKAPASIHEDLLVVRAVPGESGPEAVYFDSEGHRIDYAALAGLTEWRFLSQATPSSPGFRLTYKKTGPETLDLEFEIAPPGKASEFKPYIRAKARRAVKGK
ncbi:MAG: hypothetical protein HY303_14560 [Candidatus Wallbacteria bacterium]|nr:hypothetical protein [Candidatus Wallbacteria bacterium]